MSNLLKKKANQSINFVLNKLKEITKILPERVKNGRIEKLINYGKNVTDDYKQAIKDIYIDSLQTPRRSVTYLSLIALFTYLYKTNPNSNSFESELIKYQNLMSLIGEPIRDERCYAYLNELNNLNNQRLLRKINFLFITIYVREQFSSNLKIYQANCKYLQPTYLDYLINRIVDVGISNRWLLINRNLKNFDINPNEWKQLNK